MRTYTYDVRILGDDQHGDDDQTVRIGSMPDEATAIQMACDAYDIEEDQIAWTRKVCASYFVVSVYFVDRAYGGPEEGGWWYNYGTPADRAQPLLRVFRDEDKAYDYAERLQRALDATWNHGRKPISSVLSDGVYRAIVDENEMPAAYPKEKPHYE